jgi:glycosyltransferase involved in cell wall biosynthesis
VKIALVHDWLVTKGGSEKVLKALAELFPGTIYTLFKGEEADDSIHTSFLQKIPGIQKHYRNLLPLFPLAIESFDLSSYDLIISSSHCIAKSIRVQPRQIHICYCHTPMRYAWEDHLNYMHPIKRFLAKPLLQYLRSYDRKTASRVDHFVANSTHVAKRIKRFYGREATVIHPPIDTHLFSISSKREDYYFTCCRLVPYKRVDLLLDTFANVPSKKLLIAGTGPQEKFLRKKSPPNVTFLGYLSEVNYREILSKAKAFLHAGEEDFGITMLEAQSSGIPVISYGVGGSRDIVVPEKTGLFFEKQNTESLSKTIQEFEKMQWNPFAIKKSAEKYSRKYFDGKMKKLADMLTK